MPDLAVIAPPTTEIPTCCGKMPAPESANGTRFHFSLNVSDMEASVDFYRKLFGVPPAKQYHDYAKFELSQPPLVFSLVPNPPGAGGALTHLGFPVGSIEEVEAVKQRLVDAGLSVSCQDGTVCGYARQDKIWIADPDHNYWEIHVVHEDVDPEQVRSGFDGVSPVRPTPAANGVSEAPRPVLWEHRVTDTMPAAIPHGAGSLDEVRLTGTFNSELTADERARLLREAMRALKPGGAVRVHGLVSDRPVSGAPALPGVASLVKRLPLEAEPLAELAAAGFIDLTVDKLPKEPAFRTATWRFAN